MHPRCSLSLNETPASCSTPALSCSSLLDYVRERKRLPEPEAVLIFQQLLHSLQFCHRKDVSGVGWMDECAAVRDNSYALAACKSCMLLCRLYTGEACPATKSNH